MTGRGAMSPLSGLISEISNSVSQGNLTFAGKSEGISKTSGFGNHDFIQYLLFSGVG